MFSKRVNTLLVTLFVFLALGSCSKKTIGYGVLLWFINDPAIPSGVVLPVQVRSNIEQAWVTAVPEEFQTEENQVAMVPLPHLEFFNSKGSAERFAADFNEYALYYAETLQDGLPIRDKPENNARRTYRLKEGEIIKILNMAGGIEAISSTGDPLEGNWYKVMTRSGSIGYCFSYRLNIFEHTTGLLGNEPVQIDTSGDNDLEIVLTQTWYPESYGTMIDSGRLNLEFFSQNYSFKPGTIDGRARIHLESGDAEFVYRTITKTGNRSWNFTGTSLNVILHSESMLEAQWEDEEKTQISEKFITLPTTIETIVNKEKERRQNLFQVLHVRGPSFRSANYGTLIIRSNGDFSWDEVNLLPEGMVSSSTLGSGTLDMDYNLAGEMADRYTGAMALRFNAVSGDRRSLVFAYTLDNRGLRMEYVPSDYMSGRTVNRRAPSPLVIYFSAGN